MNELRDGGKNVVIIRDDLKKMLSNLRFQDGTSVDEAFKDWMMKKEMEKMEKIQNDEAENVHSEKDSEVSEGELQDKFGEEDDEDRQSDKTESLVDEMSEEEH